MRYLCSLFDLERYIFAIHRAVKIDELATIFNVFKFLWRLLAQSNALLERYWSVLARCERHGSHRNKLDRLRRALLNYYRAMI